MSLAIFLATILVISATPIKKFESFDFSSLGYGGFGLGSDVKPPLGIDIQAQLTSFAQGLFSKIKG